MVQALKGDGKAIFTFFVGAIIATVFLASFADSIFTQTTTFTETNTSVTVLAINTSLSMVGRDLNTATAVSNTTFDDLIERGLIIDDGLVDSVLTVRLTANDSASALVGTVVNVTYDYNPDGYISIAGGRSIALLILIISSLAILIFAVVVFIKDGSLGEFMRNSLGSRKNSFGSGKNSLGRRK